MIASLRGNIAAVFAEGLVVEVSGVGYRVWTPPLSTPEAGKEIFLHTHLHVREDSWQLFGFPDREQLKLFELLITVSGVGPKAALGVVSAVSVTAFWQAVAGEQAEVLTRIPGIGKKTAQRLVMELKDKVPELPIYLSDNAARRKTVESDTYLEARMALGNLGYQAGEIQSCLRELAGQIGTDASLEEIIRQSLKRLARM